jgi:hypothetical protein
MHGCLTFGHHADIDGYVLYPREAGWDVSGHIDKMKAKAKRGSKGRSKLVEYIKSCIRECDDMDDCAGFTLNVDICWFKSKKSVESKPRYEGESSDGWRWLYVKSGMSGSQRCR